MKNLAILLYIIGIVWSCGNHKNHPLISGVIIESNFSEYARHSAEVEILNANIVDSTLTLNVKYNGGCEDHTFKLNGSKVIQKSMPPIRGIMLIHNANKDQCRELIEQELKFNISDFKYPKSDIYLKLKGYKEKILFKSID